MTQEIPFGRYRLVSLLGEGGMATVYKAVMSGPMGFEKVCAVKRIHAELTANEKLVKAIINEARLGGQLKHENIVELYEFNEVEGQYYMAMEYVEGWTLDQVLTDCKNKDRYLPARVIVDLMLGICRGIDYAHTLRDGSGEPLNLIHRDLKPGNIMVSPRGQVKTMDFGIARADTNLYKTSSADVTKGTPVYMSPEQVLNDNLDQRSDVFALGSILHELVTLELPFHADNIVTLMHLVMKADLTAILMGVGHRQPAFVPVVEKAMQRDRELRYASVAALMGDLEELRSQLEPSPSFAEWLREISGRLPPGRADGDFGKRGAPQPFVDSTEPLLRTPIDVSLPVAAGQGTTADRPTRAMGVEAAGPRLMSRWPAAALGSLVVLAAAWLGFGRGGETPAPEPVVVAAVEPPPVELPPVELPPVAPLFIEEPTPSPAPVAAPTPSPAPRAAPAPVVREPTPSPSPVAAAPVGTGTVLLNSRPWSRVTVNGTTYERTPLKDLELPAGQHTAVFECTTCVPARSSSRTFTVKAGQSGRVIEVFEP